jgi:CHAD domain-containing protein
MTIPRSRTKTPSQTADLARIAAHRDERDTAGASAVADHSTLSSRAKPNGSNTPDRTSKRGNTKKNPAHLRFRATLHSRLGRKFLPSAAQRAALEAVVTEALALNAKTIDAVLTEETFSVAMTLQAQAPTVQVALSSGTEALLRDAFVKPIVRAVVAERPEILPVREALPAVTEAARASLDWLARVRSMEDECIRDQDIEGVHELRVALRRTRTALRWLGRELDRPDILPDFNKAIEHLRELGTVVGPVRDADVVHAMLSKRAPKGASVDRAIELVAQYRKARVGEMIKYLKSSKTATKLRSIEQTLRRIRSEWSPLPDATFVTAGESAVRFFRRELARVRERLQGDLTVDEGYHNVRRQLRRVRDVADVCGPALKPQQLQWRERLQPVQSLLGAFNDAVTAMALMREGGSAVKPTLRWLKFRRRQRMSELATPLAVTAALLLNQ